MSGKALIVPLVTILGSHAGGQHSNSLPPQRSTESSTPQQYTQQYTTHSCMF